MDDVSWSVTCGLVAPITWLVDGKETDVPGPIASFGPGAHTFEGEFKLFTRRTDDRLVAQGTRPLSCELDGEVLTDHDDKQYVPAIHRCKDSVVVNLDHCWHRVKVEIREGNNQEGEFMFLLGDRYSWMWLTQLEWRVPQAH